jgi:gamma-glutamyl:cysteine ligase YbdK (ATP-grasp superfamily)
MKTAGPKADLSEAARIFRREVDAVQSLLAEHGAMLMPTGMHPWMDPLRETQLWPHQNNEIYNAFDRIFSCKGHGWSNLQSMHINLPFSTEEEFADLHAACRLVLPLLPAIASSSPFWDGARAPALDQRLAVYQNNCKRVPSVTGQVIPEALFSYADYRALLKGIYRDISPLDPDEVLQDEWLNARGAIARFDRGAVEIRVIDTQECPEQDLAIAFFTTELVKAIYSQDFLPRRAQRAVTTALLAQQFQAAVQNAQDAPLLPEFARVFACTGSTLGELYGQLVRRLIPPTSPFAPALELIAREGTLAQRLTRASGPQPSHDLLLDLYRTLCGCLVSGAPYLPRA